jgi:cytochrome P450
MLDEDDPEHRRLRRMVQSAFTPRVLKQLQERIERLSHDLLDRAQAQGQVDLLAAYAQPIPVTVISEIVGIRSEDTPRFMKSVKTLTLGLKGWRLLPTLFWGLRGTAGHIRELIAHKRLHPGDDILSQLVQAEEEGDQLSEDELIAMVFLLIFGDYESTAHLITNGVLTLLQHPEQLRLLRAQPELIGSAVEEILRYRGPVQGTKPGIVRDAFQLHGVTIPRGASVMPLVGAANHDPTVFKSPEVFDITRSPNKHIGFGQGIHFCLGSQLARMEAKIAITNLLQRSPRLALAVDPAQLRLAHSTGWHRYEALPVRL